MNGSRGKIAENLWILWKTQDIRLWNLWITKPVSLLGLYRFAIIGPSNEPVYNSWRYLEILRLAGNIDLSSPCFPANRETR